jgi:aldehyde dehydrogenase (NAD+)
MATPEQHDVKLDFLAAKSAFQQQKSLTLRQRLDEIRRLKETILARREDIIERVMAEVGKCRTDALIAEIIGAVDWLQWLEKYATGILSDKRVPTPITLLGKKSRLFHEPYGVVLIICPWNYPFHNAITGIAAAFVAGNAVVYKPSEHSPCRGLIEDILACSPALSAAVKVVYGDGIVGSQLIEQGPGKIFFTGSCATGERIMAQASRLLIPVELELGGKDPMLVFADAVLERPVMGALWGAFTNAGQSCSAVERLLVQNEIYDKFLAKLIAQAEKLVIRSQDPHGDVDIGRMTVAFQRDKVTAHVSDALSRGATLAFGKLPSEDDLLVSPIILTDVTPDMLVWREETFGPVLPIMRFADEAEAVKLANDSEYGLCASVFTADRERALRVARALEVGGVSINNVNMSEGNPGLPFGGYKKSGFGKLRGPEGLLGFTRSKAVLIDGGGSKVEANWYPYTAGKYKRFVHFLTALYTPKFGRIVRIAWHGLRLEAFSQRPR